MAAVVLDQLPDAQVHKEQGGWKVTAEVVAQCVAGSPAGLGVGAVELTVGAR